MPSLASLGTAAARRGGLLKVWLPIACSLCTSSRGSSALACTFDSNVNRLRVRLLRLPNPKMHGDLRTIADIAAPLAQTSLNDISSKF